MMATITRIVVVCDKCRGEVAPHDLGAVSLVISNTDPMNTTKLLLDLCHNCFELIAPVIELASPYLLPENERPPRKKRKR